MKLLAGRGREDPTQYFLSQPLDQSRSIASHVITAVVRRANSIELLDISGQEALRGSLRLRLPDFSGDIRGLANEIASTARMLATVEWRKSGHQPRDTPTVEPSSLEAAIIVHLHASPDSAPAELLVRRWRAHESLYGGHQLLRPPQLSKESLWHWTKLIREQEQAVYSYWQELEGTA